MSRSRSRSVSPKLGSLPAGAAQAYVEVQAGQVRRVLKRDLRADDRSPVATLHAVARVTEPRHQLRFHGGDARRIVPGLARRF